MKLTFTDLQSVAKEVIGHTDATTVLRVKRDVNVGATKLLAALGREYNRQSRTTDMVVSQQYYQLPEDGHKLKEAIASSGTWNVPLEQVADEHTWRMLNMMVVTGQPTHYFVRGYDEIGLYPIPSVSVTGGLELVFSPRHIEMTQEDYATGTVSVANGDATVTGSGTTFTAKMVGQWFQVTDGTDGNWYKIASFTSATALELENFYQGTSGSSKAYRIGQVVDFPEEYSETPSDYACFRHFLRRGDAAKSSTFKTLFETAIENARNDYSVTTDSQVVSAESEYRVYNPFRGDPPPGGIS